MQRCDDLSTQGLPPPHDHVDGSFSIEECLDGLFLVLVDKVHIIDSQQPVVDPAAGQTKSPTQTLGPVAAPSLSSPFPGSNVSKHPHHTQEGFSLQSIGL